jgi:hypothetical protein
MKSFLLHDGEDDDKTNELHTLMTEKGLDWEGDALLPPRVRRDADG